MSSSASLGSAQKYSATRSARVSSSAEYCSFSSSCGCAVTPSAMRPEPWPSTSWISVASSPAVAPQRLARANSASSQVNSWRYSSVVLCS